MKKYLLILCFLVVQFGCTDSEEIATNEVKESVTPEEIKLEQQRAKLYKEAVLNESTTQDFVVINVLNKNTGELKEVCTKGNFLSGAVHRELKIDYSDGGIKKVDSILVNSNKRKFELSNLDALKNIGFDDYKIEELLAIKQRSDSGNFRYNNDKEMTLLAHVLFNKGIKVSENNCFGGELIFEKNN